MSSSGLYASKISLKLYCVAGPGLLEGAILTPGDFRQRWMKHIALRMDRGELIAPEPGWTGASMLELAWEAARLREFPDRPSRWDCLFFWETEAKARDFYLRRPWPVGLYEAEAIVIEKLYVADFDLISYFEDPETTATMMDRARRYWSREPYADCESREVLLEGTARITRRLE